MEERVVITGIGVISPIGNNKDAFWTSLCEGKSGVDRITRFDATHFDTQIAAEVKDFEPEKFLEKKEIRRMDKFVQYALVASKEAVSDAKLELEKEDPTQVGVILGSGIGGLATLEEQHSILIEKGPGRISPFLIPMMIADMASGQISIHFGAKGPNTCVCTACASGTHAIGDAFKILQRGDAQVMIAGGAEAPITPLSVGGFCAMKALSTRNAEPQRASRPFDKERDGFVIGEGAGVVVLETLKHASERKVPIYAEVVGYGMSSDAYHITQPAPQGEGAVLAMRMALKDANLGPQEINYINAHGTSTPLNDKFETIAIKAVFGEHAYKLAVSSTKSMTGHLLGAAGGIELIASILTIRYGKIPPTINYEYPDPECDLDYVPNKTRLTEVRVAMSNTYGFGGHNAVLVVKRYEE